MRIVHLLLTRRFAGSERYAVELANLQAELGHEVSILLHANACEERADATARHLAENVQVITVCNLRPLALLQARRHLRRLKPDVSHAHLSWGCRVLKGMDREAGLRVATLHISYKPSQHDRLDGLIAIAPWQLRKLPEPLLSRSVHIDNWTIQRPPNPGARGDLRSALGVDEDTLVFGTLGRLEHGKGVDVAIEAFKRAHLNQARLVVVGDGKARRRLEALAGPGVHFVGYSDVPHDWLQAFDIFVSAARLEPFGLVFLEAMQAGLPIISSASEGAQHLQQLFGRPLIAVGDIDGFALAFREAARERPQRRIYDLERFDARGRCADIIAFYQRQRGRRESH